MVKQLFLSACYPILDCDQVINRLELATSLISSAIPLFQIRWKTASDADFASLTTEIMRIRDRVHPELLIVINDRVNLCRELDADGVHLGQEDMSAEIARNILGHKAVIGLSTHNLEQASAAFDTNVDYIGFGPVFNSSTKRGHAAVTGIDALRRCCELATKPVVAIGGVSLKNARQIFESGAASGAVISDLISSPLETREYLAAWEKLRGR